MKKILTPFIFIIFLFSINAYAVIVEFELDPNGVKIENLQKYTFELNSTFGIYELTASHGNNTKIIEVPEQVMQVNQIYVKHKSPTLNENIICTGYVKEIFPLSNVTENYPLFQKSPINIISMVSNFYGQIIPLVKTNGFRLAGIDSSDKLNNK
ncbi:MAG: hypothetical protein HRT87_06995, partial [Legionellales bacterium]|nr:hypothetical protein [Legionellales bacterium]